MENASTFFILVCMGMWVAASRFPVSGAAFNPARLHRRDPILTTTPLVITEITVTESENVTLSCPISPTEKRIVFWSHYLVPKVTTPLFAGSSDLIKNSRFTLMGSSLFISAVTLTDEGFFSCSMPRLQPTASYKLTVVNGSTGASESTTSTWPPPVASDVTVTDTNTTPQSEETPRLYVESNSVERVDPEMPDVHGLVFGLPNSTSDLFPAASSLPAENSTSNGTMVAVPAGALRFEADHDSGSIDHDSQEEDSLVFGRAEYDTDDEAPIHGEQGVLPAIDSELSSPMITHLTGEVVHDDDATTHSFTAGHYDKLQEREDTFLDYEFRRPAYRLTGPARVYEYPGGAFIQSVPKKFVVPPVAYVREADEVSVEVANGTVSQLGSSTQEPLTITILSTVPSPTSTLSTSAATTTEKLPLMLLVPAAFDFVVSAASSTATSTIQITNNSTAAVILMTTNATSASSTIIPNKGVEVAQAQVSSGLASLCGISMVSKLFYIAGIYIFFL